MDLLKGTSAASTASAPAQSATSFLPKDAPVEHGFLRSAWEWYWALGNGSWWMNLILLGVIVVIGWALWKNAKEIWAYLLPLLEKLAKAVWEGVCNFIGFTGVLWALVCLAMFGPFYSKGQFLWNYFLFVAICMAAAGLIQWRFKPWKGTWMMKAAWLVNVMSVVFILLRLGAPDLLQAIRGSSEVAYFGLVNAVSTPKDVQLAKARKNALIKIIDREREELLLTMTETTLTEKSVEIIASRIEEAEQEGEKIRLRIEKINSESLIEQGGETRKEMTVAQYAELARLEFLQSELERKSSRYREMLTHPIVDERMIQEVTWVIEDLERRKAEALTSFESPTIAAATSEIHDLMEQRDRLSRKIASGLEENTEANRKMLAELANEIAEQSAEIDRTNRSLGRGFANGPFAWTTFGAVVLTLIFIYLFFATKSVGGKVAILFLIGPMAVGAWLAVHFLKQGVPWSSPSAPVPARSNVSDESDRGGESRRGTQSSSRKSGGAILHQAQGQGYEVPAVGPFDVKEPIKISATGPFSVYWFEKSTMHWAANRDDIGAMPDYYVRGVGQSDPHREMVLNGRPGRVPAQVQGRDVSADDDFEFKRNHVGFGFFVKAEEGVTITVRRSS